jgi:DNA-binding PadR family transcriptional regulator
MSFSTLEYALMGLLNQAPSSGYDLRKVFSATPLRHFSNSPGSIYPALRRLAARKWIEASLPSGLRGRQEFHMSPVGRKAFLSWLKQPVTAEDIIWDSGELMLRFAFMGQALPPADVLGFLKEFAREMEAYLAGLERFEAEHGGSMPLTGLLAFRHGVELYRTKVHWAHQAMQSIALH